MQQRPPVTRPLVAGSALRAKDRTAGGDVAGGNVDHGNVWTAHAQARDILLEGGDGGRVITGRGAGGLRVRDSTAASARLSARSRCPPAPNLRASDRLSCPWRRRRDTLRSPADTPSERRRAPPAPTLLPARVSASVRRRRRRGSTPTGRSRPRRVARRSRPPPERRDQLPPSRPQRRATSRPTCGRDCRKAGSVTPPARSPNDP